MELTPALVCGALAIVGCSGKKPPAVEDARKSTADAAANADATAAADASAGAPVITPPTTGDVSVRVEWPAMPRELRVSPGASGCGTPLAAQAVPTTTWGIPDVVVFVEGAPIRAPSTARVVANRCEIEPRVAVGTTVAIASSADRPLRAQITRAFSATDLAAASGDKARGVALPVVGHEAIAELSEGIYKVAVTGERTDEAWVVSAPAVLTDATGAALIKDVAPGTHTVLGWLAPRGKLPARKVTGQVDVVAGELAEVTLTLAKE